MARPSSKAKNQVLVQTIRIPPGMIVEELTIKPEEDKLERQQRLWKEKLSFVFKDLLSYLIAILIVLGSTIYSFWVLAQPGLPKEDRQWAMSMLTALGTAVVGFVFGKATK